MTAVDGGEERPRGRRRSRNADGATGGGSDDAGTAAGSGTSPDPGAHGDAEGPRKRRRSRKGLDKKFECVIDNCGKSYSRAEHLYRHQLNRKCHLPR